MRRPGTVVGTVRETGDALWAWLDRPWRWQWSVAAWIVATAAFVGIVIMIAGGPVYADARLSDVAAWDIAHGKLGCAFPPDNVPGYAPTGPGYVLISAALAFLLHIGGSTPFPGGAAFGPHCATASVAVNMWSFRARALTPTLWVGLVGWIGLAAGVVAMLRACGRGRRGWEALALLLVACIPTTAMCLARSFHPQDMLAVGFSLGALAAARRGRWAAAGALCGLAILTQQLALLVVVPLLVLCAEHKRLRFVAAAVVTFVLVTVPLAAMTEGRAIVSALVGTGGTLNSNSELAAALGNDRTATIVARIGPLVLAALLAAWSWARLGDRARDPVPLMSVVAASFAFRLGLDIAVWSYYLMALGVVLIVLDVVIGRIRLGTIAWMVAAGLALAIGASGRTFTPSLGGAPRWLVQLVLVLGALALALMPLAAAVSESKVSSALADGAGEPLLDHGHAQVSRAVEQEASRDPARAVRGG